MRETHVDVLILAAHPLELAPLSSALGSCGPIASGDGRVATRDVGVGLAAAGAGAAAAIAAYAPAAVVLLGSYGAYPNGAAYEPGTLLVPDALCLIDEAVLSGRAAMPEVMASEVIPDAALGASLAATLPGVLRGRVANTLAITTDDTLARWLAARSGCAGENLEAAAVALACARTATPFAAVLACTNQVGSEGREQWRRQCGRAAEASAALVLDWLRHGER